MTHTLSDPMNKCFDQYCSLDHYELYTSCEVMKGALNSVTETVQKHSSGVKKLELLNEIKGAREDWYLWKSNLIQGANQARLHEDTIKELERKQKLAKVTIDWAAKWLPTFFREAQKLFFSKSGVNWVGISFSFFRDGRIQHRTYYGFLDGATQDCSSRMTFAMQKCLK